MKKTYAVITGASSGIGMAFNAETFDEKTKDFILYVIDNYGKLYAGKQQMSPIKTDLPDDVEYSDLYLKIQEELPEALGYIP